eukprot:3203327-Rhodomonas_salina.1
MNGGTVTLSGSNMTINSSTVTINSSTVTLNNSRMTTYGSMRTINGKRPGEVGGERRARGSLCCLLRPPYASSVPLTAQHHTLA